MKIHPNCGFSTQFLAKLIAVCDLIFGLVGIFWFVYILESYGLLMEDPSIYNPNNNKVTNNASPLKTNQPLSSTVVPHLAQKNETISPSLFSITTEGTQIHGKDANIFLSGFYTAVNLIAFVLLLSAAHKKSILKLKIWFGIRLTIFIFKILLYAVYFIVGAPIFTQIPHVIFMFIHLYGLWVVFVFIKEIKEERREALELGGGEVHVKNGYLNNALTVEEKE